MLGKVGLLTLALQLYLSFLAGSSDSTGMVTDTPTPTARRLRHLH